MKTLTCGRCGKTQDVPNNVKKIDGFMGWSVVLSAGWDQKNRRPSKEVKMESLCPDCK